MRLNSISLFTCRWSELVSRDWLTLSRDQVTWESVNSSSWEVFASAGHRLNQMVLRSAVNFSAC